MSVVDDSEQDIPEEEIKEEPFPWGCCGGLLLMVVIAALGVWFATEIFDILPNTVSGWRIVGVVLGVILGFIVGFAQGGTFVEIVVSVVICVILGVIIAGALANHFLM